MAEIVIHKTDQSDAVVDFFDTEGLARKGNAEIDLLVVQAKTSVAGDHDGAVVERVVRFGNAAIRERLAFFLAFRRQLLKYRDHTHHPTWSARGDLGASAGQWCNRLSQELQVPGWYGRLI